MEEEFIYFDHASTSPLSLEVLEIINSSNLNYWGNVSATYKFGIECSTELESIRTVSYTHLTLPTTLTV